VTDAEAGILGAVLSAQSVAIIGLAISIARTREALARAEAQIEALWRKNGGRLGPPYGAEPPADREVT